MEETSAATFILYVITGCHFCERVLTTLHEDTPLSYEVRNIADPAYLKQLMELGGKRQAPFLYIPEEDFRMYESSDIIAYLHQRF